MPSHKLLVRAAHKTCCNRLLFVYLDRSMGKGSQRVIFLYRIHKEGLRTRAHFADVSIVAKLHGELNDTPDADGDQASASNARHDLLQVGNIVGAGDKRSSAAEEGVLSSGIHKALLLTLLDGGTREGDIAAVLLRWE